MSAIDLLITDHLMPYYSIVIIATRKPSEPALLTGIDDSDTSAFNHGIRIEPNGLVAFRTAVI